jgi:HD-GYP domain-containing protein (c-di-GMP phosphodiesterase class II)
MSAADGLDELRRCAGTQFDPAVVDAFIAAHANRAPTAARS